MVGTASGRPGRAVLGTALLSGVSSPLPRYKSIVKYKTAFYSFYLPVAAAMYMVSEPSHPCCPPMGLLDKRAQSRRLRAVSCPHCVAVWP